MNTSTNAKPSTRNLLHILFKRKRVIVAIFFFTLLAAAGALLVLPPTYQASAQLLFKVGREDVAVTGSERLLSAIRIDREAQINSEIGILTSWPLIETTVKKIGAATIYPGLRQTPGESAGPREAESLLVDEAVRHVQRNLRVVGVRKSSLVKVAFQHSDPEMAAQVVNTLCELFLDRHVQIHKNYEAFEFFRRQAELLRKKWRESEGRLNLLKTRHSISSIEEERRILLQQIAALESEFNRSLSEEMEIGDRVHALEKELRNTPNRITESEEIDHNPYIISSLQTRLMELELREKEFLTKYREDSRFVRNIRQEIEMVRRKLSDQEKKRYGKSRYGPNPTYQTLQEALSRNRAELKAVEAKKVSQRKHLAELKDRLGRLNQVEAEIKQLQSEVNVNWENYRLYQQKFEEARISNAMDKEKIVNFTMIEPAQAPIRPVNPNRRLILAIAVFFGLFGALLTALTLEYLQDTLERPEEVEEYLKLPVLASIPQLGEELSRG